MAVSRLSTLRDLVLVPRPNQAADRQRHLHPAGWPATIDGCAGERIVVGVSDHPGAEHVIRAAKNLADGLHATWTAVTVETPRTDRLGDAARLRLATSLNLAAELGGTIATVPAATIEQGLRAQLAQTRATTLVLGKASRSGWFELLHGSVVDRLVRGLPDMTVYVLPLVEADLPEALRATLAPWRGYAFSLVLVTLTTLFNIALNRVIGNSSLDMVYLVPVIVSATLLGLRPALLAAVVAALAYNFFFLPPIYSFSIQDPENLINFLALVGVGVVAAQLTGRLRRELHVGARTAAETSVVAAFGQRLSIMADAAGIAHAICEEMTVQFGMAALVLTAGADGPVIVAARPPDPQLGPADLAAIRSALSSDETGGYGAAPQSGTEWEAHPLKTSLGVLAVLGIKTGPSAPPLPSDRLVLFTRLLEQAARALQRAQLETEARRADVLQQRDDLRGTLISALGHDLRTPLTGVVVAADVLASEHPGSSSATALRNSAWRLHRLFNDLVEMTRIESGSITMRREPIDLTDAVNAAIDDLRGTLEHHRLVMQVPPSLPLVDADPRMLHHVLINLFDNAAKFSPAGATITAAAACSGNGVSLAIVDEGRGFPPGEELRLFQRFHRLEGGDLKGGTGLGLAIVKDFAEAMELTIAASNRSDHPGASFVLAWPEALVHHGNRKVEQ